MDECYRLLKDEGTVWINLGDTYGSFRGKSGRAPDSMEREKGLTESNKYVRDMPDKNDYEKCLLLIPHRFAIGCIDRGWLIRNDIIWAKRNGMPESVTDRFTKKHEFIFLMVKQQNYYFDLDSIRDDHKTESIKRYQYDFNGNPDGLDRKQSGRPQTKATTKIPSESAELFGSPRASVHRGAKHTSPKSHANDQTSKDVLYDNPLGKNPGSVSDFWDIVTQPSNEEHYAAYNTKLIDKPIISGCPKDGIILDPFCGTATTGLRAIELGRKFIGIEGSEKYVTQANKKLNYLLSQTTLF